MLMQGEIYTDKRGTLRFFNEFNFDEIKRFYVISHQDSSIIRAWQGHKIESKHFYVVNGVFLIAWVKIDNWENPSNELKVNKAILDAGNPQILTIPKGNATGLKVLEPNSKVLIFSDLKLEESKKDNYRFEADYWKL